MNRKPLVFVSGEFVEMPAGDLIDPSVLPALEPPPAPPAVDFSIVGLSNGTVALRPFGTPVYVKADGGFADAKPNGTADEAEAIGLIAEDAGIASAASGDVKTHGPMVGTAEQWDAQTGETGGLVPGTDYYLRTGGGLSSGPVGPNVTKIGKAISPTILLVRIEPSVSVS